MVSLGYNELKHNINTYIILTDYMRKGVINISIDLLGGNVVVSSIFSFEFVLTQGCEVVDFSMFIPIVWCAIPAANLYTHNGPAKTGLMPALNRLRSRSGMGWRLQNQFNPTGFIQVL